MIKIIKNKAFVNFFYLFLLQGSNYLIPLVSFPYLIRTLGSDKIGLLAFSTSFLSYFQICSDFGFNYSATRDVSLNKHNHSRLIEIYQSVFTLKILLVILLFILYFFIVFVFSKFSNYLFFYLLSYFLVISQTFFPVWFFQGIEDMGKITVLNLISKFIFLGLTLEFVKSSSDYILVPLFTSIGNLIVLFVSFVYIGKKYYLYLGFNFKSSFKYLVSSWDYFLVNVTSNVYTYFTTFMLGFYVSNSELGLYSVADKVLSLFKSAISPFFQAYYPVFVRYQFLDKGVLRRIINKFYFWGFLILSILVIVSYLFSDIFFVAFFGLDFMVSSSIFKILSINILFIGLLSINTNLVLSAFGFANVLSKLVFFSSIFYSFLIYILFNTNLNKIYSASFASVFTEFVILISSTIIVNRLIFKNNVS